MVDIDCLLQHPKDSNKVVWYNRGKITIIENQQSLIEKAFSLSNLIDLLIMLGHDYEMVARPVGKMIFAEVNELLAEVQK